MPDYMYLLESRLSPEQRAVLLRVQELARAQESNVYLTGGAVRDLISGMPLRDLDFTIEGNPQRMVRELEKGGARVVLEDERLRHYELIFAGEVDGSISGARDEFYARPGAKVELRWSTVMEDLRRRDFSINAVAISLNPNSRGLLLDPTNGLADLERREVRVLSIHAFTNQPIRLLRALRYCARMGFKMEQRTQEWFDLAIERELAETIEKKAAGREALDIGREEAAAAILKMWESHKMLEVIHPKLQRRRPDYDGLGRFAKAKEAFTAAGIRGRYKIPTVFYIFRRLEPRMAAALKSLDIPAAETDKIVCLPNEAKKLLQTLRGGKTKTARQAYEVISTTATELLVFMSAEYRNPKAAGKIRNYLQKWRPIRLNLPAAELEGLGMPRGPKFDKVLEQLFDAQLKGRGKTPPEVTKLLRQFAGIKEEPKQKEEKKKKRGKTAASSERGAKHEATGREVEEQSHEAEAFQKKSEPRGHKSVVKAHARPARKMKTAAGRKKSARR